MPEPEPVINPKTGKPKRIKKDELPKPKTASLFSTMDLNTITYEDALKLLALPRVLGTNSAGEEITVQNGRYGPYLKAGTDSRTLLSEEQIFSITLDEALEIYSKPKERRRGVAKPPLKDFGVDPVTGKHILIKEGRFGMYVTEVLPEPERVINPKTGKPKRIKKDELPKPKTASLFSTMDLNTITYEDALKLLSLPRVLGTNSAGEEVTVQNGRYGPYLKAGTDSRTLSSEDQIFSITLDEALEIYSKPKERRRGVAKPPLKDFGVDPVTGKHILVKDGRFGMYVTDGETNATLRRGDTLEALDLVRALELLAGRRAWESENGDVSPKKKARKNTTAEQ